MCKRMCTKFHPKHPSLATAMGLGYKWRKVYSSLPDKSLAVLTCRRKGVPQRRNAGRADGIQYNGSQFICSVSLDGHRTVADTIEELTDYIVYEPIHDVIEHRPAMTVSLLEMARPAKRKGTCNLF